MRSVVGRHIAWAVAVLVSAAGLRISYELARIHLNVPGQQETAGLFQDICGGWFKNTDCETVSQSEWGDIRWGQYSIPSANLGLFYFTAVFCWLLLIACPTPSRWWVHLLLMMVIACGFGSSVFFTMQMRKLAVWCPLCAATHLGNLLLVILGLLMWPRQPKRAIAVAPVDPPTAADDSSGGSTPAPDTLMEPTSTIKHWPHWWMLVVTPIIILLAINIEALALRGLKPADTKDKVIAEAAKLSDNELVKELKTKLDTAEKTTTYYKKAYEHYASEWSQTFLEWRLNAPVYIETDAEPVRGPENAKHTLIVFSDFECPSCARFEKDVLKGRIIPLANKYGGVRVIYKQWPICADCNPEAKTNLHPLACKAALAAEAALIAGGNEAFWKMHDLLYETQSYWRKQKSPDFEAFATRIGLDKAAFAEAMNSPEALARVKADVMEGINLGLREKVSDPRREWIKVGSTPSIFIDYKKLNSLNHMKTWQTIFESPAQPKPIRRPLETQTASMASSTPAGSK